MLESVLVTSEGSESCLLDFLLDYLHRIRRCRLGEC
jgi:hypothetical protein